jgi:predicted MPP superfamily phosphohydrolase
MTAVIIGIGFVALIGLFLIGCMLYEALRNQIIPVEIELCRLPQSFDGSRILFITDIHRRNLPSEQLMRLHGKVDWVLLGGDIMEKNVPLMRVERNMKLLCSIAPVFAVHGNHDYKAGASSLDGVLKLCGVELLMNRNVRLNKNGSHIWLTGMDYPHIRKRSYTSIPKLHTNEENTCRIVLVHDPAWINRFSTKPADLTLAGHTHGGQIKIPFIGPIFLDKSYRDIADGFFQWEQPHSLLKTAKIFVSRGFGYRHLPLRFRCPAEIHMITLRSNHIQE